MAIRITLTGNFVSQTTETGVLYSLAQNDQHKKNPGKKMISLKGMVITWLDFVSFKPVSSN